jgi:hypothetical protein
MEEKWVIMKGYSYYRIAFEALPIGVYQVEVADSGRDIISPVNTP